MLTVMTWCTARSTAPRPVMPRVLNPEGYDAMFLSIDLDAEYIGIVTLEVVDAHVEGNDAADVDLDDTR